jgi:hypothetical protein
MTGEEHSMNDPTEAARRERLAEINAEPGSREALEAQHGQVWDGEQLRQYFDVIGFLAPLVVVRRKADGVKGHGPVGRRGGGQAGRCHAAARPGITV